MQEVELKLRLFSPLDQQLIVDLGYQFVDRFELENHYLDTKDRRLADRKIAFRLRRFKDLWLQTFKSRGSQQGGLHQRLEVEQELMSATPELSRLPKGYWPDDISLQQLQTQFSTNFERSQYEIQSAGTVIELVVDQGYAQADDREDQILEVEFELKSGDPRQLYVQALRLASLCSLMPLDFSKAERGARVMQDQTLPWVHMPPGDADVIAWANWCLSEIGRYIDAYEYDGNIGWLVQVAEMAQNLHNWSRASDQPLAGEIADLLKPLAQGRYRPWHTTVAHYYQSLRTQPKFGLLMLQFSLSLFDEVQHES